MEGRVKEGREATDAPSIHADLHPSSATGVQVGGGGCGVGGVGAGVGAGPSSSVRRVFDSPEDPPASQTKWTCAGLSRTQGRPRESIT